MSAAQQHTCTSCGATSTKYWHTLTPGLVNALVKFKRAVLDKGENSIHLLKDMNGKPYELTRHEWNNFTKLRFHALAAKDKNAGGGYWLLTERGNQFLKGLIDVPQKVQTMNNQVLHDVEPEHYVTIEDVMGSKPYFEDVSNIEREVLPIEQAQVELFV